MAWTKRQIIEDAFAELALAGYVFDLQPEEVEGARRRLDALVAAWGLDLGYVFGVSPDDGDIDNDSGLPLVAVLAVTLGLAVQIAASKGKVLPQSTKASAKSAYDTLISKIATASVREQQFRSGVPSGQGGKTWRYTARPFLPNPVRAPLRDGPGGGLDIIDTEG